MLWRDFDAHSVFETDDFDAIILATSAGRFLWFISGLKKGVGPMALGDTDSLEEAKQECEDMMLTLETVG